MSSSTATNSAWPPWAAMLGLICRSRTIIDPLGHGAGEIGLQIGRRTAANRRAARPDRHDGERTPDGRPRAVGVGDGPARLVEFDHPVDARSAQLLHAVRWHGDGQVVVTEHCIRGRYGLPELEIHVVGVLAVHDAGHLQPKHKALGLRILCSELEQLLACGRRDPEDRLQGGLVLGGHCSPRSARAVGSTVETAARS